MVWLIDDAFVGTPSSKLTRNPFPAIGKMLSFACPVDFCMYL